eukprot:358811-Chlamydomonas_euryale.AAC.29
MCMRRPNARQWPPRTISVDLAAAIDRQGRQVAVACHRVQNQCRDVIHGSNTAARELAEARDDGGCATWQKKKARMGGKEKLGWEQRFLAAATRTLRPRSPHTGQSLCSVAWWQEHMQQHNSNTP